MIVSHKYRFIFLRTEKTGSTSLTAALQSVLGEDDLKGSMKGPAWAKYSPIHYRALQRYVPQLFGLHTHATARQVRDVVGRKIFDSYYKFAVERNPWDRQISLYAHRQWKIGKAPDAFDRDMQSFIYRNTSHVRLDNWSKYAIGKEIVADRVLRYERLDEEIAALFKTLGIGAVTLPRLRKYTADRPHYSTYYSDATRDLVDRWYGREIEAFGYEFERPQTTAARGAAGPALDRATLARQPVAAGQGSFPAGPALAYGTQKIAGGLSPANAFSKRPD